MFEEVVVEVVNEDLVDLINGDVLREVEDGINMDDNEVMNDQFSVYDEGKIQEQLFIIYVYVFYMYGYLKLLKNSK